VNEKCGKLIGKKWEGKDAPNMSISSLSSCYPRYSEYAGGGAGVRLFPPPPPLPLPPPPPPALPGS
jgi:hypothetical protein